MKKGKNTSTHQKIFFGAAETTNTAQAVSARVYVILKFGKKEDKLQRKILTYVSVDFLIQVTNSCQIYGEKGVFSVLLRAIPY